MHEVRYRKIPTPLKIVSFTTAVTLPVFPFRDLWCFIFPQKKVSPEPKKNAFIWRPLFILHRKQLPQRSNIWNQKARLTDCVPPPSQPSGKVQNAFSTFLRFPIFHEHWKLKCSKKQRITGLHGFTVCVFQQRSQKHDFSETWFYRNNFLVLLGTKTWF